MLFNFFVKIFHFNFLKGLKRLIIFFCLSLFLITVSFTPAGKRNVAITRIVIDPGHGGKDPGTLGNYTKEKSVVLQIALEVGKYLTENMKDIEVIYTRTDDSFVELERRSEIAHNSNGDLFVSIHANSLPKRTSVRRKKEIKGAEVYVMGAQNTERALEVAKRENSVILLEDDYEKKYDFDPTSEESYILYNLTQDSYQDNSLLLASLINNQLKKRAGRDVNGVKQSSLYVLWSTAMPSVLVEIGYLSNPHEERDLNNPNVRSYIASGIYRAIKEYKEILDNQN